MKIRPSDLSQLLKIIRSVYTIVSVIIILPYLRVAR
jgi:hypothetical protein